MKSLVFVGNYAPRCCGIATFTHDLRRSLLRGRPELEIDVAMVSDNPQGYDYPAEVKLVLSEGDRADYRRVATAINRMGVSGVCLQHEFGIYGGPNGEWILELLQALRVPIVTTCHTLLREPTPGQRHVLRQIGRQSARMVVMAQKGREFLRDRFEVPDEKITVIPHGIPDSKVEPDARHALRQRLKWNNRDVLLTFGLLSPNKGLEYAIRALPEIVSHHPDALYVVVGATHPNLVREQGETYREGLLRLAGELGVAKHLQFINRFVSRDELVGLIDAADIYVTPYLNEAQITSGTLAYAYGMGKPVISTPYWHAAELLAEGAGVLVPFNSSAALASAATALLADQQWRDQLSELARARGQTMTWPNVGQAYLDELRRAARDVKRSGTVPAGIGTYHPNIPIGQSSTASEFPARLVELLHLERISGRQGIFQHARLQEADPAHGFCLDDNARALIFATSLAESGDPLPPNLDRMAGICRSSIFRGYNPSLGRFRNFMDADGNWLEQAGSEDSHGRVLWALGHFLSTAPPSDMRISLAQLFLEGSASLNYFTSPRAWAFALLGLQGFREIWPGMQSAAVLQHVLADRLVSLYRRSASPGWEWFEDIVTYDNGKLPQALLATWRQTGRLELKSVGLASLTFLVKAQTAGAGHFRPIGCQGFWRKGLFPSVFDQQPLEAQAMVAACLEAGRATSDTSWLATARRIHAWFHGANDLGLAVADVETGGCHDGLQPQGLNLNQGAESTLAYLQATVDLEMEMRRARERRSASIPGYFGGGPSSGLDPAVFAA